MNCIIYFQILGENVKEQNDDGTLAYELGVIYYKQYTRDKKSLKRCQSGGSLTSMMWFANCQHQKRKKFPQIACCTHFSCHNFYALYVYVKISQGVVLCFVLHLDFTEHYKM